MNHSTEFLESVARFQQSRRDFKRSQIQFQNNAIGTETAHAFMSLLDFAIEAGLLKDDAVLSREDVAALAKFYGSRLEA